MSKKQPTPTVRPASEPQQWVRPPGMRGAWYTPAAAREVQEHVLGADDRGVAYREALLMHELHEKLDATFVMEEAVDGGAFPWRELPQP